MTMRGVCFIDISTCKGGRVALLGPRTVHVLLQHLLAIQGPEAKTDIGQKLSRMGDTNVVLKVLLGRTSDQTPTETSHPLDFTSIWSIWVTCEDSSGLHPHRCRALRFQAAEGSRKACRDSLGVPYALQRIPKHPTY